MITETKHTRRYYEVAPEQYENLWQAGEVLSAPPADIVGRDAGEIRKGLRNPEKANIALLGEPGTGKAIVDNEWLPVADERGFIRMGDVEIGDEVFDEHGQPTKVIGVYPQGKKESYRVHFAGGSSVVCNDEHLWNVRTPKQHDDGRPFETKTLRELLDLGITRKAMRNKGTREVEEAQWYIPKAKPVVRTEKEYGIHPYVIGALTGDLSDDEFVVSKVADLLDASGYDKESSNFIQPYEVAALEDISAITVKSHEKRIPEQYLSGSIEQRWQLLQGLMDTDGSVLDSKRCRCSYHTSSPGLAEDVQELVTSLGMSAIVTENDDEYDVHLSVPEDMEYHLFTLPRRLDILDKYQGTARTYNKKYTDVAITSVEYLGNEEDMTCILVAADSHLFQVTKSHIVTHNTAAVQAFAYDEDSVDHYLTLEVNPEKVMGRGEDKDSALLVGFRNIVEEAGRYSREQNVIVVLFIDEFHKIAMFSPSLVEALKPILEKSALNNFRIIASTTFEEYNEWIASQNRALDQRFLRMTLSELPEDVVVKILYGRAKQHGVEDLLHPDILNEIYQESKSILMSNSQPRASIDLLLSMIGETVKSETMMNGELQREFYTPKELDISSNYSLSRPLLKRIIQRAHSVDIDNQVDVLEVSDALRSRLFNQDQAIDTVMRYLEMAAVGFSEPDRPKFSFLATGSTGTGKAVIDNTLVPVQAEGGMRYKAHGDLEIGDVVFDREGNPTNVTGVYPQGELEAYEITFGDGSSVICNDEHLWTYMRTSGNGKGKWHTVTLGELMEKNVPTPAKDGRTHYHFAVPMNGAVNWPAYDSDITPYALGALLGDGAFRSGILQISSDDEHVVQRVAGDVEAYNYERAHELNHTWVFASDGATYGQGLTRIQTGDVIPEALIGLYSHEKFIPEKFKGGSIEQRWELINGLFDTDGHIKTNTRYSVSYSSVSKQLIDDIQNVLRSLGINSKITTNRDDREDRRTEYHLHAQVANEDKPQFFTLPRKKDIAKEAASMQQTKKRHKNHDCLRITGIRKLGRKEPMTCIMVDNDEHLYQVSENHIVTHNTELAKIVSETMQLPLRRFDMSRYAQEEAAGAFADDLFHAAWSTPNAYLLIDEVEKSSRKAMNILLQVLDDARLADSENPDRVASFSGSIINMTTNAGSKVFQSMQQTKSSDAEVDTELIYKALRDHEVFESAVLGRIDTIVPFRPLPSHALERIARESLQNFTDIAETHQRPILMSPDIIPYIVKDRTSTDTERGGARDVKRNIRNLIAQEIARHITYADKEVPVIIYIKGRPRFKFTDVADPMNAVIGLKACHSVQTTDKLLDKIGERNKTPLLNEGLFLPADVDINTHVKDIHRLIVQGGFNKFKTEVDGETFRIVGVE